jgi:hypothetical protein
VFINEVKNIDYLLKEGKGGKKEWCVYLYGHPYVQGNKKNLFSYLVAFLQGAF